ncbi:MAG: hypothetical protein OXL38_12985, partial [Gammaproteobacteria bacterium]|nr:hypothetical protein [Gammaproteobacteria bacterium]
MERRTVGDGLVPSRSRGNQDGPGGRPRALADALGSPLRPTSSGDSLDRDAEAREVAEHLRRNTLTQLAHGLFGQTGFRLVSAPTFLPAYLFMLSGSDFVVGLARSLQGAGTVASPMLGASLIGHRKRFLGVTLASS